MKPNGQLLLIVALGFWSDAGAVFAEGESELLASESGSDPVPQGLDLETIAEFRQLDRDRSGTLSLTEFRESEFVLRTGSYLGDEKIEAIYRRVDADGEGEVSLREFTGSQHNRNLRLIRPEATRTYVEIDSDLDGLVQSREFSRIEPIELENELRIENGEDARALFRRIDLNQNRVLGPFEYSQALADHRCHSMKSGKTAQEFAEMDGDDSGYIDEKEFSSSSETTGKSGDSRLAFGKIDSDGNGELNPREFFRARSFRWQSDRHWDAIMVKAFEELDNNRNGVLSRREFSRGFFARHIAEDRDEIDENFSKRDTDDDGELTLQEFSDGRKLYQPSKPKR